MIVVLLVSRRITNLVLEEMNMSKGNNQHVLPHGDAWAVRGAGNTRVTSKHATQLEAIEKAREIAIRNESELLIHNREGRIRAKNSYGDDPHPPKG